jgi:hypothetical protein
MNKRFAFAVGLASFLAAGASFAQGAPAPAQPPPPAAPPAAGPAPAATPPGGQPATFSWGAQTTPQADSGGQAPETAPKQTPRKLSWRGTSFSWDQSATTETVGIGDDVQSVNPTYDWAFSLKPRYYVYEDDDQTVSVRGDIGMTREFTNSDATTEQGEWSLTDVELSAAYARVLYQEGDYKTDLSLRAPILSFPTSEVSQNNGKILGVGTSVGVGQQIPITGTDSSAFQTVGFTASAGYRYTFTEFTVPTNDDLGRVRMDLDGRSVASNQLSGAAFAQHVVSLGVGTELAITDRISWGNSFGWRPSWKYTFDDENDQQLCGVVLTGCVEPDRQEDRTNFIVVTTFASEVGVKVLDEMSVAVGYNNITGQLGADGKRRNMLYSPDARVFLTVTAHIDEIYKTASGYDDQKAAKGEAPRVAKSKLSVTPAAQ